jgi:CheY-like chemotaxis protein
MKRVVVVEDDPMSRRLIRDLLEVHGYEVVLFERAEDCVTFFETASASVVLMDVRLPGIDGFEALERLRAMPAGKDLPFVAVTASVMLNERARIEAAGFDAYHPKPIQISVLLSLIDSLVN